MAGQDWRCRYSIGGYHAVAVVFAVSEKFHHRTLLSLGWLAGLVFYSTLSTSSSRGLTYQIELNPFCHLIVPSLVQNLTNATSIRSLIKKASLLITEIRKECNDNNCDCLVSDKWEAFLALTSVRLANLLALYYIRHVWILYEDDVADVRRTCTNVYVAR
jgi:hypothetical protein